MDFLIGGLAACGASIFSNPFDVLKTRMQLQGELRARGQHAVHYKNALHAAYMIATREGVLSGLQKGLGTSLILHSVRNSVRLGLFQWMVRNDLITVTDPVSGRRCTVVWRTMAGSAVAGAAGAFLGSPFFLIKTQLQSQAAASIAVGYQHQHKGLISALKTIFRQNGIVGLWRGANSIILRTMVGSASQLTTFSTTKELLTSHEVFQSKLLISLVASMVGGVFQTVAMTPFDLISVRLYNQGTDASGKGLLYNGILDCFVKIWRTEGFLGFYKGITANYMRLGPHSALCLVFWDLLKDAHEKYGQNAHK